MSTPAPSDAPQSPCKACNGSGQQPKEPEDCTACEGTGKASTPVRWRDRIRSNRLTYVSVLVTFVAIFGFWLWARASDTKAGPVAGYEALFTALAFLGVIIAILLQRKELQLQRQELEDTREVLKSQQAEMKAQASLMELQAFDRTFFSMFDLHVKSLDQLASGPNAGLHVLGNLVSDLADTLRPTAQRASQAQSVAIFTPPHPFHMR